ncbi:hypothetical protein IE53DRAFT_277573 [Violaceomyces palustris]|uniref:Uncharacterized protein n=1 Tax=Violaceomyces palustris TaxID=1673888 RepID=A0ACD0NMJ9_9BASI|nr:hypothetical protein IE53DRAFT_277573 [Violaceomyces palustris]
MASTTTSNPPNVSQQQIFDLSHFLRSIDPSSSSSSEPSQSAPKLPTSATISLLDAQIQTLQSQLSQALTSDRLGFKQKLENNHHAERRLETLWNQVSQISNATYNDQDLESNLRRSIRDYRDVLVESDHHRLLVDCLELVTQATSDLELAEAMLENDDLRALQPHLEKLKNSASKVGACKALATKSLGEGGEGKMLEPDQGPSEDFTFLASHFPEGLPAIKELALRIEAVEETLEKRLQHLWENFFNVHLLDPTGSSQAVELTSIRVSIASSTKGSDKVKALSLSDLAEVSSSRGELRPRLKAMANEVIERCAKILLASDRHPSTGVQVSWMFEEEGGGDDQQFQRFRITARANADGRGQGRLETLQAILAFIQKRLFDVIDPPIEGSSKELDKNIQAKEQADRGRLRTFSEEMIPKLVPLILEHLEGRLPTRADPIEEVMASLEHISGRARDVEASLRTLRFAPADEGTEGLDADEGNDTAASLGRWADEIGSHFSNKLMKRSLERARKLILEEGERGGVADAGPSEKGGGGWEGVVVEVDPKIGATIPAASGDPSDIGDALPTSEASLAKAKVGGVKVKLDAGGDDDTWDDFDNGWNQEEGRLAKASSSTGMSRSVSSSTTNRNSLDSTGSGRASPKSASSSIKSRSRLGGVRVIRHQDQLGSGPFDNEDEIDEQGWGLDDDVVLQGDDGAGIKKVEEEEEGKVKIAQVVKEGGEAESGLGQGEEEQDGPWFKEEREAERKAASDPWEGFGGSGNESKRFQEAGSNEMDRSMTQSSTSSSNKAFEYQEEALDPDLDLDDAWGLTEEEIAEKRMSMIGGAAGVGFDLANQHPLHVHPNLDRTKVEQGQVKQEVEREGFGSIVSGQAPIGPDGRGGDDDDLDLDEAWGLTEEEVREKRASLLWMPSGFTVPKEVQGTDKIHQHVGREGDGSSQGAEQVLAAKVPEGGDIERFAGIVAVGERVDQASTEQDRAEGVELEDPREQASEAPTRREEALLSSRSEGSVLASDELPQPSQIPSAAPLGRVESSLAAESQRLEKKNETDTNPTDQGVREGVDPDRDEDQEGSRKESVREDDQGTEGSDDPWDAIIDDDRQIGEEDQMENQQAQQASQGVQETIVRSQVEKSGGMGQGEEEDGVWGIQRGDSQPIEEGRGDDHVRFGSRVPPFEMEADSTRPTRSNQEKVEVSQEEAEPHDDDDDDEHEGDSHKDGKVYLLHHDSSTGRDHPFATSMESFVPTSDRGTDTTVPSEASHGEGMEEDDPVVAWGLDDDPVVDGDGSEEGFLRANQDGTLERKEGSGLVEKQGRVDGNEGQQGREMENEIAEDRDGPKEQPTALDAGEDVNVAGWGWNEEEEEEEDNKVGGPSVPSTTTRGRNVVAEPRKPFQEVKSSSVSKTSSLRARQQGSLGGKGRSARSARGRSRSSSSSRRPWRMPSRSYATRPKAGVEEEEGRMEGIQWEGEGRSLANPKSCSTRSPRCSTFTRPSCPSATVRS